MHDWQIGNWYLAVNCRNCGIEFPFQRDDETPESTYFTDNNQIVLTCPECSYPLPYEAEEIKRVQAR